MAHPPLVQWGISLFLMGFLSGCGPSSLSKKFTSASRKQTDLSSQSLRLWKRSPSVDSGNLQISSKDNLDLVPRSLLSFADVIDTAKPVESAEVKVFKSTKEPVAPSFYDWAGRTLGWKTPEFQVFMAFHHANKAKDLVQRLLPDVKFSSPTVGVFPVSVYALEPGGVAQNHYASGGKSIYMYHDAKSIWPDYHVVDEADAVYHEFAHAIQDALNPAVLNYPQADFLTTDGGSLPNRDLDSIVEGTADFFAAAVARDDVILSYLSAHLPSLIPPSDRKGTNYKRSPANTLSFPAAYLRDPHLDGRVISAVMNDLRKLLEAQGVAREEAFDRASLLMWRAFAQLTTSSTFFDYASLLESTCLSHASLKGWCSVGEIPKGLSQILVARGIKGEAPKNTSVAWGATSAGVLDASTPASTTPEVMFDALLSPMPYPNDPGFANADAEADRCEVLVIYPNFSIVGTSSVYDITVELMATTGFTALNFSGTTTVVEESVNTAKASKKVLGWMKPAETTPRLVNFVTGDPASRWYADAMGSTFTRKLAADYYPSDLGWLVRAPAAAGAQATAKFRVTLRRANANSILTQTSAIVTQRLTVSTSTTKINSAFCP